MDKPIIEVNNLGKKYLIGEHQPYLALRDSMAQFIRNPFHLFKKRITLPEGKNDFWALKDVNFTVNRGEVIGIIGRNGAGKSTLLKIISQITPPTTGSIHLRGRAASLLEVGTGFHPELTGRENIMLNGALLGMKKQEIKQKFDQIVEFAEISKFLDTPVKRYSSGMYVRLAFSVAAHLEPEILIVDEVLAVGDTEFQKKCLGKMEDVTHQEGRTILFVSHNMDAIKGLCKKTIFLEKGKLINFGNTNAVIEKYLHSTHATEMNNVWQVTDGKYENQYFSPTKITLTNDKQELINTTENNIDLWINIEGIVQKPDPALQIGYVLYDQYGTILYWSFQTDTKADKWPKITLGSNRFKTKIPKRFLNEGTYTVEFSSALFFKEWLCEPGKYCPAINFTIQGGLSDSPYWTMKRPGLLAPEFEWIKY